jgi:signal transduction histidine kinase
MTRPARSRRAYPRIRFRGLRAQIVLWTLLPLTLVLIGVAFTGIYSHERAMRTLVQDRDQALAAASAAQVRDLLADRAAALQTLAAEQAFHHQRREEQQRLLAEAGDLGGLFAGPVILVGEAGDLIISGTTSPLGPLWPPGADSERLASLARTAMLKQDVSTEPLITFPAGLDYFLLGIPVYDERGAAYGVLVGPVALQTISTAQGLGIAEVLAQVQVGEHGIAYLVDATGQILAHSPATHARHSLAGHTGLQEALTADSVGTTLCLSPDGERMTLSFAPVDSAGTGWVILIEQPWREVIGPVLRYSQFVPLVAALALIVSVLTLYYGIRAIVRPLQALGVRAEKVAWGDFSATSTPVGGVEEIEDLRRTLDQMAKRIQNYQGGMHDYIAAITRGQEEERKRLARELHDDTAQALIALGQQVEMAQKTLTTDPARAAERLDAVRAMLAETLAGVRRFSRDLRPIYLDDLGFLPAIEMLARLAGQQGNLSVVCATTGPVRRLPPDLELAAYRIVQEALNNVLQHARASSAWVEIRFEDQTLVLSVRDNGAGFQLPELPDALARRGHFGLMGIQERALLYGGVLVIRSTPGEGTEIEVRLVYPHAQPLEESAAR